MITPEYLLARAALWVYAHLNPTVLLVAWAILSAFVVGLFAMYASVLRTALRQTLQQQANGQLHVAALEDLLATAKREIAFRDGLLEYAAAILRGAGVTLQTQAGAEQPYIDHEREIG